MNMFVRLLSAGIGFGCWWCPLPAFATTSPQDPPVRINEWMTSNLSIRDEDGDAGDWIELYNGGTVAVNLSGWHLSDSLAAPARWALPVGMLLPPGGFYWVWADGKNRSNHTNFRLGTEDGFIGLFDATGAVRDFVQYGSQVTDISQGRLPDGSEKIEFLAKATPGRANSTELFRLVGAAQTVLSPAGAAWRYFDRGEDLGTIWREASYNDSNWAIGRAQLGFGDNDEATVINGGPDGQRYITTYFRRSFFATNTAFMTNLSLRLLRDDGAVIYLNGIEIHRDNMPPGQILFSTLASSTVADTDESNYFVTTLGTSRLVSGNNVFAVELHQSAITSSDLSFDLELLGGGSTPGTSPQPGFILVPVGGCVELQAPPLPGPANLQWLRNNRILPGQTNRTLQFCGVQTTDGGAYGLLVTSGAGRTTVLTPTDVVVEAPSVPFTADGFFGGMQLFGTAGVVQGNNSNASREPGEPFHHGVSGGRSMWFHWIAPATGIASFDTTGSGFDTLLAVYTGLSVSNLTRIASDDEHGRFSASRVEFNAQANVMYHIAVDGFEGAAGYFTLNWALETTPATLPVIFSPPESETVSLGGMAVFSVGVGQQNATYQWLLNGRPIPNAISNRLVIPNVTAGLLGDYSVRVGNNFGRIIESDFVRLVLGDCARFYDRLYTDLQPCRDRISFSPAGFSGSTNPPSAGVPGTIQLGGFLYGEAHYTPGTGTYFVCDGVTILSPQFYDLQITDDGFLRLDTCGSGFLAVMALYHKAPERLLEPTYRIACDVTSALVGQPAQITAQVTQGVYTVVVGRLTSGGGDSTVRINERLGPSCILASQGAAARILKVNTNRSEWADTPFTSFRWFKDGAPVASTPGPTITIGTGGPGLLASHVGTYTVVMTNLVRSTMQLVADIILTNVPSVNFYRLRGGPSNDGDVQRMELEARSSRPMWLEASSFVLGTPIPWVPLDRRITNYHVVFTECDEPVHSQRFFRQRILAP